ELVYVTVPPERLPKATLWRVKLGAGPAQRVGEAVLGLEGGRTAVAWPTADTWLTARGGADTSLVASRAGTLEPATSPGQLPLAAVSRPDARGAHFFSLQSVLQSDVYVAGDAGVRRLTDTAENERISGWAGGAPIGMTDAFGGWALTRFLLDGGSSERIAGGA